MDVSYPSEAVRNARVPISHAHMYYGRLLTYYWYILKLLTFQRSNKSQSEILLCLRFFTLSEPAVAFCAAKLQQIFDICKKKQFFLSKFAYLKKNSYLCSRKQMQKL